MFYASRGSVPPTRHTQHRAPDGSLYAEELFGVEGFTGRSSLLYHLAPPTRVTRIDAIGRIRIETADEAAHHHQLVDTAGLAPAGDAISGRVPLFHNADVVMGVVLPAGPMPPDTFYRNGEGDEMLFVHEGTGTLRTNFGDLAYHPGDYLVLPIGTTWRLDPDEGVGTADAVPRVPVRARAAEALPQRLRAAPGAQPVLAARHPRPGLPGAARRGGRLPGHRPGAWPSHGLPLRDPPLRRRRLGRLPVALRIRHRGLPADHRARPPAAAGPPDVPGTQLRRVLVRAPQVRLPPPRDPGARTTTRTSTATRSSTTWPATS